MTWVISSPGLPANPVITGTLTVGGQILAQGGVAIGAGPAILASPVANTLALLNLANAQRLDIYGTADAGLANYERLSIITGASITMAIQKGGSGSDRTWFLSNETNAPIIMRVNGSNRWSFEGNGNLAAQANNNLWSGTSALATTATAGFLGVNSCAGAPTGVPASIPTGQVPLVFDVTNLRLYAYVGGTWRLMQAV